MTQEPKLISERLVPQRAGLCGPRIGKVQVVEYCGKTVEINFWYDQHGQLLFVR